MSKAFVGTIVFSGPDRRLIVLEDHLLGVDGDGFITHLDALSSVASQNYLSQKQNNSDADNFHVRTLPKDSFLLPGFIDTHSEIEILHKMRVTQYLYAGTALDKPLMEWLVKYTFKSESRIDADPSGLGMMVYRKLVSRMIEMGTTAASVFGTLTVEANLVLARCFQEGGIRGQIGKVAMDLNGIDSYIENTEESLSRTKQFIKECEALTADLPKNRRLVQPVVTPRFVPTCSEALLRGLADIAKEKSTRIQSHMSESQDQMAWSTAMWSGKPDVQVLDELGLLNDRSLMAHCTHTSEDSLALLAARKTSVAHCPLSNVYFSAEKPFPLREAWDAGVSVGLGSDISGGYRIALDDGMRWAVGVSRIRAGTENLKKSSEKSQTSTSSYAITWQEAIYLATLGGAKALGLDHLCGSFQVGKAFDAQLIHVGRQGSKIDLFNETLEIEALVEKWFCNGSDADRVGVWVQGRMLRSLDQNLQE